MLFRSLPESVRTFCLLYQLGNESESAAEYYDMTTSDGNGDWNLDAVGTSGHRCTKCGSRKHGASMCDADFDKSAMFQVPEIWSHLGQTARGGGKGVIKGKGKTKGKSKGKAKGKGFGKKGKINELGMQRKPTNGRMVSR